jgi:hypothetical protein
MKQLRLCCCWLLLALTSLAQPGQVNQINITSFQVKTQLPAEVSNWATTPGALLLVAQRQPREKFYRGTLTLQIKRGSAIVCMGKIPVDSFNIRTFNNNELCNALRECKLLPEGDYQLCARFYNIDNFPISIEACRPFIVKGEPAPTTFTRPQGVAPQSDAKLKPEQAKALTFRWTPLVPKPKEPVTYRMRVWQLMQGQNASAAMRGNSPVFEKDVTNQTQAVVSLNYPPCRPPYLCDFVWTVQALNPEGKPLGDNNGTSEPMRFGIQDAGSERPGGQPETVTAGNMKLVAPANDKRFTINEMKQPLTFRWTPLVPKPRDPVTYRLRVWQLMQGQNTTAAMKENKPVVTKEVKDASSTTVANLYTGPCRPPYLCDFVWTVQAIDANGKVMAEPAAFAFGVNDIDTKIDALKVGCCINGKQTISITVQNMLPNVNTTVKELWIMGVNGNTGAPYPINISASLAPALPFNFLPSFASGSQGKQTFTGTINCIENMQNIIVKTVSERMVSGIPVKDEDIATDTLVCPCTSCKEISIKPSNNGPATVSATGITQSVNFSTGPMKVKTVKADLVWFEFTPEKDECIVCPTPSAQFGNFTTGTLAGTTMTPNNHGLVWNFAPPKDMVAGVPLQYTISYPTMVGCCGAKVKWCIRYTVTYENCVTCSVVVCNEAEIKGCSQPNTNPTK